MSESISKKQKAVIRASAWNKNNPDRRTATLEKYYAKNRQLVIDRAAASAERNRNSPHYKAIRKRIDAKMVSRMPDCYIKSCLKQRGFSTTQITPDLIAAERALVKLKRAVKEMK